MAVLTGQKPVSMTCAHLLYVVLAALIVYVIFAHDLNVSWFIRKVLGRELISFIASLVDAKNPNSSMTVGFLFMIAVLAYQGVYAMHDAVLRTSAFFWSAWAGAVGSVFAMRWLATKDSKFTSDGQ